MVKRRRTGKEREMPVENSQLPTLAERSPSENAGNAFSGGLYFQGLEVINSGTATIDIIHYHYYCWISKEFLWVELFLDERAWGKNIPVI